MSDSVRPHKTVAHQTPPSLGFSRQEHWSGLPFPSPMHESEKWKWSRPVMSNSLWPHGLQPIRLLHPWDFPGKSTGVGCHRLLRYIYIKYTKLYIHNIQLYMKWSLLSRFWLFVTLWTVAYQAPLFMRFCRQEYWSGLPFPSPTIIYIYLYI